MLLDLGHILKTMASEPDLRALILTGAGEAFCTGTDEAFRTRAVCDQIEQFPVPVIAAVNGIAAGGGCELALACHLRTAATSASFKLPKEKLGHAVLEREVGRNHALEMVLIESLPAAKALQVGLVNRVAEGAELLSETESLAREIGQLAPLAIRACLKAMTRGLHLPLEEGLALESEIFAGLFATEDMREGTLAFLERRSPVFKGI